jgi:hypothetical protein
MTTKTDPAPIDQTRRYTIKQALTYLGYSRYSFYRDVAEDRISVIKSGRRTYVSGVELARLCAPPTAEVAAANREDVRARGVQIVAARERAS